MRKILFAWEWGHGWGHLAKAEPILKRLADQGHAVHLLVPHPGKARQFFNDSRFKYDPIPALARPNHKPTQPSRGLPDLLLELGYDNSANLCQTLLEWSRALDRIQPDLILADYCLTLPLASRGRGIPIINLGTPFSCPPPLAREYLESQATVELSQQFHITETLLRESMAKAAVMASLPAIEKWGEFWGWRETIIASLPEFEVYPRPAGAKYWGPILSSQGLEPVWPEGKGPKIFIYTNPFPGLGYMLDALAKLPVRALVVARNFPEGAQARYQTRNISIVNARLNTALVASSCDAMIMNPGHGMVSTSLLASIPSLLFPQHREQDLLALALAKQKLAAIVIPKLIHDWKHVLTMFLQEFVATPELQSFAKKYRGYQSDLTVTKICEYIASLTN